MLLFSLGSWEGGQKKENDFKIKQVVLSHTHTKHM